MATSLKTQAGLLAAGRAIGQVLNALVSFVAARQLLQEDFGTFRQIYLLFATLLLITDLGQVESLYYFLPRHPNQAKRLLWRSFNIIAAVQLAVVVLLVLYRGELAAQFKNPQLAELSLLFALFLTFNVCSRPWEVYLVARQRSAAASLVSALFEIAKAGSLLFFLFVRPSVHLMMWALVVVSGLKLVGFLTFMANEPRDEAEELVPFRRVMAYSSALWLPGAVNVVANQAHQFLVSFSFSPEEFAVYSVACFQLPMLGVLTTSVIEVMLVRITAARARNQQEEVVRVWNAATSQSMLFFIPLVSVLAALSRPLLTVLFTKRFASAAPLFAFLTLSLPLTAIFTNNVLRAYGAMREYTAFYFLRLALSLGLGWLGIHFYGMWGAAISSVLTLYLVTLLQLRTVARLLNVSMGRVLPWGMLGRLLFASLLAAFPAILCANFISNAVLAVFTGGALFAVTCAAVLLKLRVISREQITEVATRTGTIAARVFLKARGKQAGETMADNVSSAVSAKTCK